MEKYDAAGFLRATAKRLREGSIDAETAALRLDDVADILSAEPTPDQIRAETNRLLRETFDVAFAAKPGRSFIVPCKPAPAP